MKFRSKTKHGFTNHSCLHCAFLKTDKERDMQFFLQNVQNEIFRILRMFKYNMKFIRAACWINSKIRHRDKNTTVMIRFFYKQHFYKQCQAKTGRKLSKSQANTLRLNFCYLKITQFHNSRIIRFNLKKMYKKTSTLF